MTPIRRIVVDKRLALTVIGGLVLADALLYGVGVYPQRAGVARAEGRARMAAREVVTGQAALGTARARLDGKTRAKDELQQFYDRVLPQDLAAARSITYPRLAALAGQMGLVLERRTADRDRDEDSELARLRTTMLLAGEYGNVRRFIEALETAPEFLVIEEIVLSQREEVDDASLTLGVATYYRTAEGT